jgi:hypothetical protein
MASAMRARATLAGMAVAEVDEATELLAAFPASLDR